jgi:hypothetical protein
MFLILLLDISMPPYEDKGIYSGEDKLLLNICQIAKLFFTMFTEFLKIKTIKI